MCTGGYLFLAYCLWQMADGLTAEKWKRQKDEETKGQRDEYIIVFMF
jgi:hypothetical protein